MVVVSRKIVARTSAARSGATSARKVCAGRPFFIRIGVSHASRAPAARTAVMTSGQTRGSRSSTLVSRTSRSSGPSAAAAGLPTSRRSTLAWPSGSRPPAPTPTCWVVIGGLRAVRRREGREQRRAGRGAQLGGGRALRAGVRRDAGEQGGNRGRRDRQGAVRAADGIRSRPRSGVTTTSVGARWAKPAQTPTTSAIASRAPTSWKWTSIGSWPCTAPSATASRSKTRSARSRTSSVREDSSRRVADVSPGPVLRRVGDVDVARGSRRSRCG